MYQMQVHIGTTLKIQLNHSMCGSNVAFLSNYFDHLLIQVSAIADEPEWPTASLQMCCKQGGR